MKSQPPVVNCRYVGRRAVIRLLKAMLRNATGCDRYEVIWDTDEDGQFEINGDDVVLDNRSPSNGSVYDVGTGYRVPNDAVEGRHLIAIRATNKCNGFIDYDVMRLYVYPWTPSSNPSQDGVPKSL